jgi:hypothetical protein
MVKEFSDAELDCYIEETLDSGRASELEAQLRLDETLLRRLTEINARRESGQHTLGGIWRQNQIGVPSRDQMGSFLLGVLDPQEADYIQFRVDVLKCPFTIALKTDLENQNAQTAHSSIQRRAKIFDSSVGLLKPRD